MKKITLTLLLCFLAAGCGISPDKINPDKITSINIIDHNGLSETISGKDRLGAYEATDFLSPQPYQKVMRVYGRSKNGDVKSCITSYHPNGQIKQYLEAVNNRAFGGYKEWFANGQIKVEANIIGGVADVNNKAEESWLFDDKSKAYDEDGHLMAEIPYEKGELQGEAVYYHPNGKVWKISPYDKNLLHGQQKVFLEDGSLFQVVNFVKGVKEGPSTRYWDSSKIAFNEEFKNGLLVEAAYFSRSGERVSEIFNGSGQRAVFGKKDLIELQEFKNGVQEGKVKVFDESGHLIRAYYVKNGEKNGEEIDYFAGSTQPKLLLTWNEGILQGPMKTWYENGNLESQREVSENKKNGLLTAWYRNGALMLVEEYENDKLQKGEYYRQGERVAISKVDKGKGMATLFTAEGNFSRKVYYQDGRPIE